MIGAVSAALAQSAELRRFPPRFLRPALAGIGR
jgi:hypothetical protein